MAQTMTIHQDNCKITARMWREGRTSAAPQPSRLDETLP
jgi:hypothetical protein